MTHRKFPAKKSGGDTKEVEEEEEEEMEHELVIDGAFIFAAAKVMDKARHAYNLRKRKAAPEPFVITVDNLWQFVVGENTGMQEEEKKGRGEYNTRDVKTFDDWKKLPAPARNSRLKSCMMRVWLDGKKCTDCDEKDVRCLDNDHVDPTTKSRHKYAHDRVVGHLIHNSVGDLPGELAKTVPRCRNCHRRRHAADKTPAYKGATLQKLREREQAEKRKRGKCADCGIWDEKCLSMFDWDHTDPTQKVKAISHMVLKRKTTITELDVELAKCVLRCASCHMKRTAAQFSYKQLSDFLPHEVERARVELFGTEEEKTKIRPKPAIAKRVYKRGVQQVDMKTGMVVAQYDAIEEGARATGADASCIYKVAAGKLKQHKGYKWRLIEAAQPTKATKRRRKAQQQPTENETATVTEDYDTVKESIEADTSRRIQRLDATTGKVLAEYDSFKEAIAETGALSSGISRAANGEAKTHLGYKWRYSDGSPPMVSK
jgi:hypothetical protein